MSAEAGSADIAALARGGRTNFIGFLLRLLARVPFLFIAGRLYGPDALGRFAFALVIIELAGLFATLGLKRGLAQRLSMDDREPASCVADAVAMSLLFSAVLTVALFLFPQPLFPSGVAYPPDLLLPLAIAPLAITDLALAALAYRYNVKTTVYARAVVEPWTLSIAAAALWFAVPDGGMSLAYILSNYAAMIAALVPLLKSYGLPRGWTPRLRELGPLVRTNLPLAVADVMEWGSRRLDIAILGLFASPAAVGVYWAAQQVASLPQKLKTSFEPILGPVITRNLKEGNLAAIARQVCQVGFWITAAQAGIALALGIPGEGVMGLVGPAFVGGTGALAFLLAAEVVAATAVVSEAALVYVARMRNLMISAVAIALQAILTVGGIMLVRKLGLGELYNAAAAAAALMLSLGFASLAKARLLSGILGERINNWRWSLVWAAAPAVVLGWVATRYMPEWAELAFGIPAILSVYMAMIWRYGFGPEDRVLFRKSTLK
ncbi:MAG: oligosaccharide flippase family protein [Novosphingobium sp.]|nr:oligosaccharide flippase family protein [Novosphingobium sp.]